MGQQISQFRTFLHDPSTLRSGYILGYSALFGANVWASLVGGVVAYKTLPREMFGLLQSRLFPVYWLYSSLITAGLLTLELKLRPTLYNSFLHSPLRTIQSMFSNGNFHPRNLYSTTAGLIFLGGMGHVINGLIVGPRATEVMFRRHRLEKIEGRKFKEEPSAEMIHLNKTFGTLHSISSSLNLVSLVSAGFVGWKLGASTGLWGSGIPGK